MRGLTWWNEYLLNLFAFSTSHQSLPHTWITVLKTRVSKDMQRAARTLLLCVIYALCYLCIHHITPSSWTALKGSLPPQPDGVFYITEQQCDYVDSYVLPKWQNIFQLFCCLTHSWAPDSQTGAAPATRESVLLLRMTTYCIINAVTTAPQLILIFHCRCHKVFFYSLEFHGKHLQPAVLLFVY